MDGTAFLTKVAALAYRKLSEKVAENDRKIIDQVLTEHAQVAHAVAVAAISIAMGKDHFDEDVQGFIEQGINDPRFPARLRRLFQEALMSPTKRRRIRLAAVLFGGPAVVPREEDLERVDILVARLLDEDVDLLRTLRLMESSGTSLFLISKEGLWYTAVLSPAGDGKFQGARALPSTIPMSTLVASGCVEAGLRIAQDGGQANQLIKVTDLGSLLLETLSREPISSGIASEAESATSPARTTGM